MVALLHLVFSSFIFNAIHFFDTWDIFEDIHIGAVTLRHPISFFYAFPFFYIALAAVELVLAAGILGNQRWAQKSSLVLAFFYFFNFPLGTGFAIYMALTFWEMPSATVGQTAQDPSENATAK